MPTPISSRLLAPPPCTRCALKKSCADIIEHCNQRHELLCRQLLNLVCLMVCYTSYLSIRTFEAHIMQRWGGGGPDHLCRYTLIKITFRDKRGQGRYVNVSTSGILPQARVYKICSSCPPAARCCIRGVDVPRHNHTRVRPLHVSILVTIPPVHHRSIVGLCLCTLQTLPDASQGVIVV